MRTATLEMLVQHPAETAEKIRLLAEREGGFLVSAEVRGQEDPVGATLNIRVRRDLRVCETRSGNWD